MIHEAVPLGKDDEANRVERTWGDPAKHPFPAKSHVDLLAQWDLADIERAGKAAGARFYYEKNELVLLDLALQRFALDHLAKKGFTLVLPPFMLRRDAYLGATAFTSFEETLYKIDGEDLYLIATAEHPLVAMRQGETLEPSELPLKLAGISPCFRKEAGAHGRDTKGIFRVHHFHKVEQVAFCAPEESAHLHEELLKNAEELFQKLELPYQVVTVASGSMGDLAARQYDLNVWMPAQGAYREAVSCSNCTDYQARTLGIRMRRGNDIIVPHSLNSTAIAIQRAMVAILENFQDASGVVTIPKALQGYTGFTTIGGTKAKK
jgi:seryl-tRNA synthetase